ncbi:MAG: 6-pyruvoyl tetrahydropterin synthase family protein [Bdellovibrionota bacterium]
MKIELKQQFQIESARFLPHLDKNHPCSRTHGHSFVIWLTLQGPLQMPQGWLIDYNEIQIKMKPILEQIDHRLLNEVPGLENPTTENLCIWLYQKAQKVLPQVTRISIRETSSSECNYPT